ncbi:MAG: hypothetical protein S4CHLAM6_10630 [Chlamydiae bacterium]|nr:hypothetical protein [Chlamydiota bacterium]
MNQEQVYDTLRSQWVVATPEEIVRQKWLEVMMGHLSFPKDLLVVEKKLSLLPHLNQSLELPERRVDILAYSKEDGQLKPLLLIECKCIPLSAKALLQVKGYNDYVQAPYIAIANEEEIRIGYLNGEKEFETLDFLPAYPLLLKALS